MSSDQAPPVTRRFSDVHAIEEELARVRWKLRSAGESEAAEQAAAEARASVLNLIAVVTTEAEVRRVSAILDGLSTHQPSRTLTLLAQQDRTAVKLEASVTAHTSIETGHRVTVEQVLLHAHGQVAEHLASLVSPLLIPDLPVMLWWPGRPDFESRLFDELTRIADRLVVDTDEGFLTEDFGHLLKVSRRLGSGCAIGDFNWARVMPWRHLAAQFFDVPSMREHLAHIRGVFAVSGAGSPVQARLLTGWVQSRMRAVGIDAQRNHLEDPALEHGVRSFWIETGGANPARFAIQREDSLLRTECRGDGQQLGGRTVSAEPRLTEELLAMELTNPGHDVLYEEALACLV